MTPRPREPSDEVWWLANIALRTGRTVAFAAPTRDDLADELSRVLGGNGVFRIDDIESYTFVEFTPDTRVTPSQLAVLRLVARGWSAEDIASMLDITSNTVRTQQNNSYARLGVNDQAHAIWELSRQPYW